MSDIVNGKEKLHFWLVGAYIGGEDKTDLFIREKRWENGYDEKYKELVNQVAVGDMIAIKATFTQKANLPFKNNGQLVSVMRIKAIGHVTENLKDGKNLKVDWDNKWDNKDWYGKGTYFPTINKVSTKGEINQELFTFIFDGEKQDLQKVEKHYGMKINNKQTNLVDKESETSQNTNTTETNGFSKNIILYGPPGTGKTYNTVKYAVAIIENNEMLLQKYDKENYPDVSDSYKKYIEEGRIVFVTFHQSYGYEEFIEGIKPVMKDKNSKLEYEIVDGVFKEFCKKADENGVDKENNIKRYVFIIDEINRGNISKIFGELITLIESNKRKGKDEEKSTILPYSGKPFSVPDNVYILGTMNTADRSIALIDTALRRRFSFVEMKPESKVLEDMGIGVLKCGSEELNVAEMLRVMNKRIEYLYDREHTIGHGFFTSLIKEENRNKDNLKDIFKNKIIPLLQEYFYDDYKKIQLVLGDDDKNIDKNYKFIIEISNEKESLFKGSDDIGFDIPQVRYEINPDAFENIESYIKIYKPSNDLKKISENTDAEQKTS